MLLRLRWSNQRQGRLGAAATDQEKLCLSSQTSHRVHNQFYEVRATDTRATTLAHSQSRAKLIACFYSAHIAVHQLFSSVTWMLIAF